MSNEKSTRREFVKKTSLLAVGGAVSEFPFVITSRAQPDDPIRVGVIGCGGRGTGAALNILGAQTRVIYPRTGYHTEDALPNASIQVKNVKVVALADMFRDRLDHCRAQLAKVGNTVAEEYCFTGFDACRKLTALSDVNYVILATPPHFRPATLRAAIEAGKHVFAEKPLAVDGPGVRSILDSAEIARKKNLGIVCGAQRRHQSSYVETVKRIQDGAIGEIVECRANWNGGGLWVIARQPSMTDMEWQLRNWNYFTWLSGDHIVEQHIHNYDVINWIVGRPPVKATSLGGRQVRTAPEFGNIFDHFATEFEYENGMRLFTTCRQIDGCSGNVSEAMVGSKGRTNCRDAITGAQPWKYSGPNPNPYEVEHAELIASIRAGKPLNEAKSVAESTLMGIMARNSAYTGQTLTWEQVLNSKQDLSPAKYEFGPLPIAPVPVPGSYTFE